MRVNKTLGNLERIWTQLDNACGELENALHSLTSMRNLDSNIWKSIERNGKAFDEIVSLKNEIEEMIEEKKKEKENEESNLKDEWHYEHSEFDCDECKKGNDAYPVDLYLGTHKGKDAMKYVCTNSKCHYVKVVTFDELHEKEYGN